MPLQGSRRSLRVGLFNPSIEAWILYVSIVVVRTILLCRIRRVADDNTDPEGFASGVSRRRLFSGNIFSSSSPFVSELERVGQHRFHRSCPRRRSWAASAARIARRAASSANEAVEGLLDVDRGDVVGEQDDFVGVQLMLILAQKVPNGDKAALQQTHNERAGAGERVEDLDVLCSRGSGQTRSEVHR